MSLEKNASIDYIFMFNNFLENIKKSVEYSKSMTYDSDNYYSQLLNFAKQLPIPNSFAQSAQQELIRSILQGKDANNRKIIASIKTMEIIDNSKKQIFLEQEKMKDTKGSSELSDIYSEGYKIKIESEDKEILKKSSNHPNQTQNQNTSSKKFTKEKEVEEYGKKFKLFDFSRLPLLSIGKLPITLRAKKMLRYKKQIYKYRKLTPLTKKFEVRSNIAKSKQRVKGRFVKQKKTIFQN